VTSEAFFSREQAEEMNSVLASTDRFDFDLNSVIKDADGNVVAEALGHYAVRIFG
jgi:hypothetical protein